MNTTIQQYNSILNSQQTEIKTLKSKVENLEMSMELLKTHGIKETSKPTAPTEEDDEDELGAFLRNMNKCW